jgi:Tol biopolymer transport system component
VGEGKSIQLSSDNENSFNTSWSSDGSKIFFWSTVDGNPNDFALFSVNKNGTGLIKLSLEKNNLRLSAVSESPTGLITFSTNQTSAKLPNTGIFLFDPTKGLLERIVPKSQGSFLESPVFSPDGSKIAYLNITRSDLVYTYMDVMVWNSDSKSPSKIVGIKASGSLKFDYLWEEDLTPNLVWSPDGNRILFTVPEGNSSLVPEKGVWNLYVINSDGTNLKKITNPSRQIVQFDVSWGK